MKIFIYDKKYVEIFIFFVVMKEKYIIFCFLHKIFKIFIYYPLRAIKIIILKIFAFLQIEILAYNFVENFEKNLPSIQNLFFDKICLT